MSSCAGKNKRNFKHGEALGGMKSPELRAFFSMRARCLNPRQAEWHRYGGRGITIHPHWLDRRIGYLNFLEDVGRKPGPEYSLDRYPNRDGNYEPGNVRWATSKEQGNNTNRNHFITYRGEVFTVTQLLERFFPDDALTTARVRFYRLLARGWSEQEAIETPAPGKRGRPGLRDVPLRQKEVRL
jgi:hypothetical protein